MVTESHSEPLESFKEHKKGETIMKKVLFVIMAVTIMGLLAAPAWAGGPEETGREWIQRSIDADRGPEVMPEAGYLYYIDLMSNATDATGGWLSFLVVGNWSLNTRIHVWTQFIPSGGTPSDIRNRDFFINPNDVLYLTAFDLGFASYGNTNWFGLIYSNTNIFYTAGVLLYHSEYGLTWIAGDGAWQL
jgi:hypothetical protein